MLSELFLSLAKFSGLWSYDCLWDVSSNPTKTSWNGLESELNILFLSFCQSTATFWKRVALLFKPDPEGLHLFLTESKYAWFWGIINWVPALSKAVMKRIYLSKRLIHKGKMAPFNDTNMPILKYIICGLQRPIALCILLVCNIFAYWFVI